MWGKWKKVEFTSSSPLAFFFARSALGFCYGLLTLVITAKPSVHASSLEVDTEFHLAVSVAASPLIFGIIQGYDVGRLLSG